MLWWLLFLLPVPSLGAGLDTFFFCNVTISIPTLNPAKKAQAGERKLPEPNVIHKMAATVRVLML